MVNLYPYWDSYEGCNKCSNLLDTTVEESQTRSFQEIVSLFDENYPDCNIQNFIREFPEFREILDQLNLGEDYLQKVLDKSKVETGYADWDPSVVVRLTYLLTADTIVMRWNQLSAIASQAVSASKGEKAATVNEATTSYSLEIKRIKTVYRPNGGLVV